MRKIIFSIGLVFLLMQSDSNLFAQSKDEELAGEFYANGEFEKAAEIYASLIKKNKNNTYLYNNYLNSLLALNRFDDAEGLIKNMIKKNPGSIMYQVELGYLWFKMNQEAKATQHFELLTNKPTDENETNNLAQAFLKRNYSEWAIKTYVLARKKSQNKSLFVEEIFGLYATLGKMPEMVDEALVFLLERPEKAQEIQNKLQFYLSDAEKLTYLKKEIQKNLQGKNADNQTLTEFFIWVLIQEKNFNAVFIQNKAIDKKKNEGGRRLLETADVAMENLQANVAIKCYEYIISLGEEQPFFLQAQFGLIEVRYKKITLFKEFNGQDLADTEKAYLNFMSGYGDIFGLEKPARQLAHIYSYYMDSTDKAIQLLENLIQKPANNPTEMALAKLDLGDAYLMKGDMWEAELLYAQVDKDYKEDELGREAKFRMAKLFFYKAEFERANAYLEVLKTSTTQLTSNDAVELSLLIQDNTGLDSTEDAMAMYANADLLIYRNKIDEGLRQLLLLQAIYPIHTLQDEVFFLKYKAALKQKRINDAIKFLEEICKNYRFDILADNALFALAEIYEFQLKDLEKAKLLYEELLVDFSSSVLTVEARKRYRRLRGDKLQEQKEQLFFMDGFN